MCVLNFFNDGFLILPDRKNFSWHCSRQIRRKAYLQIGYVEDYLLVLLRTDFFISTLTKKKQQHNTNFDAFFHVNSTLIWWLWIKFSTIVLYVIFCLVYFTMLLYGLISMALHPLYLLVRWLFWAILMIWWLWRQASYCIHAAQYVANIINLFVPCLNFIGVWFVWHKAQWDTWLRRVCTRSLCLSSQRTNWWQDWV